MGVRLRRDKLPYGPPCDNLPFLDCEHPDCYHEWQIKYNGSAVESGNGDSMTFVPTKIGTHEAELIIVSPCGGDPAQTVTTTFDVTAPTMTATASPNRISKCGRASADITPVPCIPYRWRILSGNDIAQLDPVSGEIEPRKTATHGGPVVVQAYLTEFPQATSSSTTVFIEDDGGGGCCGGGQEFHATGSGTIRNGSVDVAFDLGPASNGESAGVVWMKADAPSTALATPASLVYNVSRPDVEVIKNGDDLRHGRHRSARQRHHHLLQLAWPGGMGRERAWRPHDVCLQLDHRPAHVDQ